MAIVAAGSSYMSIDAQNKTAEADGKAAVDSANADYGALAEKAGQVQDAAAIERLERVRQGLRERAKGTVSAGEAGLAGNLTSREASASMADQGHDMSIIEGNKRNNLLQINREGGAVYAQQKGRLNNAKSKVSSGANAAIQIGLAGAGGAVQGYSMGSSLKKPPKTKGATA